jgi:hypothetical protein
VTGTPIDIERLRSIGYLGHGRSKRDVREYRDRTDGHRVKAVTDEAGNTVTEHANKLDQVDVMLRPKTVELDIDVTP